MPPPGYGAPAYGQPMAMTPTQSASSPDRDGVGTLKIASLLGLIDQAMFWIGFLMFYLIVTAVSAYSPGVTAYPGWITVNTVYASVGLLIGGAVVGLISYIFYYLGFRKLKQAAPELGTPATLSLIGLIGFLMIAGGIGLFLGVLVSAISSPPTTAASAGGTIAGLLGALALLGIGGILGFIGVIGVVLGNWRAGKRYQESMIKVGGILQIFPYVSIVGFILCLVGYIKADKKLESGWMPPLTQIAPGVMVVAPGSVVVAGGGVAYAQPAPYGSPPPYQYGAPQPQYAPSPAPAPAPVAAAPAAPLCPRCGRPTTFVAQYNRYYCYGCQQYA